MKLKFFKPVDSLRQVFYFASDIIGVQLVQEVKICQ